MARRIQARTGMFGRRSIRPSKRKLSFVALGLAPVLVTGGFLMAGSPVLSGPLSLSAGSEVTLIGHGHGHGRGLGQWGAFGYAKRGWSAAQILNHYYGGTTAGKASNPEILVTLTKQGSVNVRADAGMRVGGQTVAPGQAVSLSGGTATITNGCGGSAVKSVAAQFVEPVNMAPNRPASEFLKFCGTSVAYRGALGLDGPRVVNKLNVDDYVKGVIPKESSPGWGDQGGAEALKAQAVAARSYALAAIAGGKKIDDTQNSQVYGGVSGEDPRTNSAADATAGQVRLVGGKVAITEFSASTGGYTAGGTFPAVADEGDSIAPVHNWTATVSSGSIGSAFGVGNLQSFEVIEANGLGAEDGRAVKVRAVGSGGTKEVSGEDARKLLQLKSAWFSVKGQASRPKIVKPAVGPSSPSGLGSIDLPGLANSLLSSATSIFAGRYSELGGLLGPLGKTVGLPTLTPDGAGVVQLFDKGMMLFSKQTGAHVLAGEGLTRYKAAGGLPVLGFPREDALR